MHSTCPVSPFTLPKDKGAERCGHLSATQYAFPDKSLQSTRGSPNKDVAIGADAAAPTCPTLAFGRSLLRLMAYHWFRTSTGKWEWSKLLSEVPLVVEPAGSNGSLHSGIARYQGLKLETTTELSRRIVWDWHVLRIKESYVLNDSISFRQSKTWIGFMDPLPCWTTEGNAFSPCNRKVAAMPKQFKNQSISLQTIGEISTQILQAMQLTGQSTLH